jgi:hypothetical protein
MKLIDKNALVAEIEKRIKNIYQKVGQGVVVTKILKNHYEDLLSFLDTLEVKEVDIDKLCEFRKNIGFAYPESASEYQKQLTCYRQGIKDAIKAQKGE